jgi:asparagine synthase (glutamine-hydrolysing)
MCGICGVVSAEGSRRIDVAALVQMRDVLTHRGPDDAGVHVEPGVGIASRRLAIIDLSERGHMPMSTPDGRFWIVYNGEVYNHRALREPLEAKGHRFLSGTDTEVVLRLFIEHGPAMLPMLNGMFAFAIWDSAERTLFIGRDRLGVKPLYLAVHDRNLYFASEEKALFAAGVPLEFDHDTWQELLCFRFVAGELTPYRGVRRLLPGHYLVWKEGQLSTTRWWNLSERARVLREVPIGDPVRWYRETFDDAIRLRRISDVPVGVLLSGGLDSSSVAASVALQANGSVESFTVGFAERGYDERPLATTVAQRYRLHEHHLEIPAQDLMKRIDEAAYYNDEPLAHKNDAHLLAISQLAKRNVTVLLSGEGADETLGGYVRYRPLKWPRLLRAARPVLPRIRPVLGRQHRVEKLSRFVALSLREMVLYNACETLPNELESLGLRVSAPPAFRERIVAEAETLYPDDLVRQAMYSDQHTFLSSVLDRNDRMTMGASIECRVPFLDFRLVEQLAALPSSALLGGSRPKPLLRRSLGDRLPPEVLGHPKWGFGVPWRAYMRKHSALRSIIDELPRHQLIRSSPLDRRRLEERVLAFNSGDDRAFGVLLQLALITKAWDAMLTTDAAHMAQGRA